MSTNFQVAERFQRDLLCGYRRMRTHTRTRTHTYTPLRISASVHMLVAITVNPFHSDNKLAANGHHSTIRDTRLCPLLLLCHGTQSRSGRVRDTPHAAAGPAQQRNVWQKRGDICDKWQDGPVPLVALGGSIEESEWRRPMRRHSHL